MSFSGISQFLTPDESGSYQLYSDTSVICDPIEGRQRYFPLGDSRVSPEDVHELVLTCFLHQPVILPNRSEFKNLRSLRLETTSELAPMYFDLNRILDMDYLHELALVGLSLTANHVGDIKQGPSELQVRWSTIDANAVNFISKMYWLQKLVMHNNYMETSLLLSNFTHLESLEHRHDYDNPHRTYSRRTLSPIVLSNVPRLRSLIIDLEDLPQCTKFEELCEHVQGLTTKCLENITTLYLYGPCQVLPDDFFDAVPNLEQLRFSLRNLSAIPTSIGNLCWLREFANYTHVVAPDSIVYATRLTDIFGFNERRAELKIVMYDLWLDALPDSMAICWLNDKSWPAKNQMILKRIQDKLGCPAPLLTLALRWINMHRNLFDRDREKLPLPRELIEYIKILT